MVSKMILAYSKQLGNDLYISFIITANSLRNHSEGVVPDNDIRQWENENHTHALAAVEALDN